MKLYIKATPKAKKNSIVKKDDHSYRVYVTAPADRGRANIAIIKLLAKHFKTSPSKVHLVEGLLSRDKIIEIIE